MKTKFKKSYIGKKWKKIFEPKSVFILFYISEKLKKKVKVKFRTTSGKKFCTIKFTKQEFASLELAAQIRNQSLQEFFDQLFQDIANGLK